MQPTQLDPGVVNLAKAIRQTESGGNFQAVGKSGEYGAYQFEPTTFAAASQKYLGQSVPLNQATPEQQNEVAYKQIAEWKSQGYNVGQIASMWNAGPGKPNAYLTGNAGVNSSGVNYDTAAYAKKVATAYQQFKAQTPQSQPTPTTDTPAPADNRDFLQKASDVVGSIFPGKQIGNYIGTKLGYLSTPDQDKQYYDQSTPTPLQLAGDAGQIALTVGTAGAGAVGEAVRGAEAVAPIARTLAGAAPIAESTGFLSKAAPIAASLLGGGTSAAGRIAANAGLGAGFGATGALANGSTNLGDIGKQAAFGGAIGGVAGGIGESIAKFADTYPKRIINNLLPQLKTPETLDYAVNNLKLGTPERMLAESTKALDSYDNAITALLKDHPEYSLEKVAGSDIIKNTLSAFPNSEYTPEYIVNKLKSQIPGDAALITRLEKGTLSLNEANSLRQAIDRVTYKTVIDSPEVKAGKDVAAAFGNALRSSVKEKAPETVPIFSNYSKEINLNKAIKKLVSKSGKTKIIGFKDLVALGIGGTFGGVPGAVVGGIAEKAANSPALRVGAAKAISASAPIIKGAATIEKNVGAMSAR